MFNNKIINGIGTINLKPDAMYIYSKLVYANLYYCYKNELMSQRKSCSYVRIYVAKDSSLRYTYVTTQTNIYFKCYCT